MELSKGIYYLPLSDKVVILSKVKMYEDLQRSFVICTWEDDSGIHDKVLIADYQFERFFRLGDN